jgi:hypothetical protein
VRTGEGDPCGYSGPRVHAAVPTCMHGGRRMCTVATGRASLAGMVVAARPGAAGPVGERAGRAACIHMGE